MRHKYFLPSPDAKQVASSSVRGPFKLNEAGRADLTEHNFRNITVITQLRLYARAHSAISGIVLWRSFYTLLGGPVVFSFPPARSEADRRRT